jgi:hypothetical protein
VKERKIVMTQRDLDPQDQASEISTYQNEGVAQQWQEGLFNRWEADVKDILATKGVVFSVAGSHSEMDQATGDQATSDEEQGQRLLISQIYIRCQWKDIPLLRQWIRQFLAGRQPDATIIATGMAKQAVTKVAVMNDQNIEGYLVIGSVEQDLHGSVAEQVAEHLVSEKQIDGYAVYTFPIIVF